MLYKSAGFDNIAGNSIYTHDDTAFRAIKENVTMDIVPLVKEDGMISTTIFSFFYIDKLILKNN